MKTEVDLETLLENEKEWRKYLIKKMTDIEGEFASITNDISAMKVWNIVFRLIGGGAFAIILIWIDSKLN